MMRRSVNNLCNVLHVQVEARNELESYVYSLKNQINDKEKLGGKLDEDDKKVNSCCLKYP